MNSTVKDYLNQIAEELNKYSNISRENLFTQCVSDKLKISLKNYQNNIDWNTYILELKNPFAVLKAWKKRKKIEDKDIILQNTMKETDK